MTNKINLTRISLIGVGLLAATVLFAPNAPSAAQGRAAITSEFSAQQQQDKDKDKKKAAPAARKAPRTVTQPRATSTRGGATADGPHTVTRTVGSQSHIAHGHTAKGNIAHRQAAESHIAHAHTAKGYVARS